MRSMLHVDWQGSFSIANQRIEVAGNSQRYVVDVEKFISMYAPSKPLLEPLCFDFLSNGEQQYLIVDGQQELWHGQDAQEIVAAFEIQLYTQVLQRIFPHYLSLHAGCVSQGDETWLFAGQSGAGKSSVTTAALLAGWHYLTDEFSLLDAQGKIHPMPRPMQWDTPEHPAFPHTMMLQSGKFEREFFTFLDYQQQEVCLQLWLPKVVEHQAKPLTRLIFPRFDAAASKVEVTPLRRSEALMELPQHLHQQMVPSERMKMLNQRLPRDLLFYRMVFSDVHEAWSALNQIS